MDAFVVGVLLFLAQQSGSPEGAKPAAPVQVKRTDLNLLGGTDASAGESRRNENVQFNLIDNNALKYLNIRLGTNATIITEFQPERKYFGTEFGSSPTGAIHLTAAKAGAQFPRRGLGRAKRQHIQRALVFPGWGRAAGARERLRSDRGDGPVEGRASDGGGVAADAAGKRERECAGSAARGTEAAGNRPCGVPAKPAVDRRVPEGAAEPHRHRSEGVEYELSAIDRYNGDERAAGPDCGREGPDFGTARIHEPKGDGVRAGGGTESGHEYEIAHG